MKRKLVTFLTLLLVMTLLLAGCGDKADDVGGTVEVAPPDATTPDVQEPENQLSLGRMDGGVYTNTYAGIGCNLDDTWTFYGADELQDLPETVANAFEEGSEIAELLDDGTEQISDMMAENATLLCNMNVLFQKVSMQDRLAFAAMGEAEMIDLMLDEADLLKETYAQMGMEITAIEPAAVTFLGEERTAMRTVGTIEGISLYMVQLFDYSRGAYSVTMTFTSYMEDNTQTMLDLFYAVD